MSQSGQRRVELIAFDVDGTLIEHSEGKVIWQVLNRTFAGDDKVNRERYQLYREGHISYGEWVELDVGGWVRQGATRHSILEAIERELRPVTGARETLEELSARGYRLAVISGSLDVGFERFFADIPFRAVYMNRLLFDARDRLCGYRATPYDMDGKAEALRQLAQREQLSLARCAFVGDHLNDVAAARAAGYAVAFTPRCEELEQTADAVVEKPDLRELLPLFP